MRCRWGCIKLQNEWVYLEKLWFEEYICAAGILAHYVDLEKLTHGTIDWGPNLEGPSIAGYYKLGGSLKIKEGADLGLLQGAVVLKIKK